MGKVRVDRTLNEWMEFGPNLLTKIESRKILHKQISQALTELGNAATSKKRRDELLIELNSTKNKLGNDWILWVRRLSQKKTDQNRKKFYVNESTFNDVMAFSKDSEYEGNINRSIEHLFLAFTSLGLTNISNLYELNDVFAPFKDALKTKANEQTFATNDIDQTYSILTIMQKLTAELKANKIQDFNSIASIKRKIREAEKLSENINKPLRAKQNEIDNLKAEYQQITTAHDKIKATMQNEIDALKMQNSKIAKELNRLKPDKPQQNTQLKRKSKSPTNSPRTKKIRRF